MAPASIHFVKRRGDHVEPSCGDWSLAANWTTAPNVATCPECIRRIREQVTPNAPVSVEGDWFGRRTQTK